MRRQSGVAVVDVVERYGWAAGMTGSAKSMPDEATLGIEVLMSREYRGAVAKLGPGEQSSLGHDAPPNCGDGCLHAELYRL